MRRPTLGKGQAIARLRAKGYSARQAEEIYEAMAEVFREAHEEGCHLKVFGLGTLRWTEVRPKRMRLVGSGEVVLRPGGWVLRFRPARRRGKLEAPKEGD